MVWVWLAVAILLVLAMDRFLLWAEGRGWVYWRRQRVRSGGGGGVFGELIQVFQPSHQFVVEEQQRTEAGVEQESADDDQGQPFEFSSKSDPAEPTAAWTWATRSEWQVDAQAGTRTGTDVAPRPQFDPAQPIHITDHDWRLDE